MHAWLLLRMAAQHTSNSEKAQSNTRRAPALEPCHASRAPMRTRPGRAVGIHLDGGAREARRALQPLAQLHRFIRSQGGQCAAERVPAAEGRCTKNVREALCVGANGGQFSTWLPSLAYQRYSTPPGPSAKLVRMRAEPAEPARRGAPGEQQAPGAAAGRRRRADQHLLQRLHDLHGISGWAGGLAGRNS